MKCSDSKRQGLLLLIVIIASLACFASHGVAQKDTGAVTGRVVDPDGNPVAELPIFIAPLNVDSSGHMRTVFLPNEHAQLRRAHTDLEGRFSITGVSSGPVYIGALPYNIDELLPKDFEKIVDEFIAEWTEFIAEWTEMAQDDIDASSLVTSAWIQLILNQTLKFCSFASKD